MAKRKYDKNFSTEVVKEIDKRPGAFITSTRHLEKFGGGHLSIDSIYITRPPPMISHPQKLRCENENKSRKREEKPHHKAPHVGVYPRRPDARTLELRQDKQACPVHRHRGDGQIFEGGQPAGLGSS